MSCLTSALPTQEIHPGSAWAEFRNRTTIGCNCHLRASTHFCMFFAVLRSLRAQHWKRCPAHRPLTRRHITSPSRKSGNEANRKSKTCTESSATFNSDVDWPLVRFWHPAVQPPLFLACTESFRQNEKLFGIRLKDRQSLSTFLFVYIGCLV